MPIDPSGDITEIARRVLLTLSRQEIPVTPENYQVWFEYMIGSNPELNKEIDTLLAEGTRLDDAQNRGLYEKHFGEAKERKFVQEISQATFRILKEALEGVVATGTVTQDYSERLNVFATRLETDKLDPEALKEIIEALILDTRKVEQSSSELSQQLEKAKQEANELRQRLEQAEREATRDVLTGLYNRKYLDKALQALHSLYREKGAPFSVIMMDVDHFKKINDTYGHKVGDSVLSFIGQTITGSVKGRDVPARYGGEEFIVLLPATSSEDACKLAESLRKQICSKALKVTKTQKTIGIVTVSCGVAQIRDEDSVDSVVDRADQALYLAKESGRNRVLSEKDLPAQEEKVTPPAA
jgi:diguanylate cyclase